MNTTFNIYFNVKGLEGSLYRSIPDLRAAMQDELVRVYNIYADKTNAGITERLNNEFYKLYPSYMKDNQDKDWYEMSLYNKFMADGYQRLVVDDFNKSSISPILDFYVDPEEVIFTGMLKVDHNVTIDFYLKEA